VLPELGVLEALMLAKNDGQLICLIRGMDDVAAKARLDAAFKGVDSEFESLYQKLSKKHLQVWAGDITEPNFGLTEEKYQQLTIWP